MMSRFEQMDQLKDRLDQKRPFPKHVIKNLHDHLVVEWTYHSNSIEGNTLTLSETKVVLEDGITIGGKSVKEHLEALNHREAIFLLEDIVKKNELFSERVIKDLHAVILRGIDNQNAGVYRKTNVLISGAKHIPPDFLMVEEQMVNLIKWYQTEAQQLHPVERAAKLHSLFVKIHPFIDGNGRTARLLLNLELLKSGFVPIVIKKEQRLQYYQALDHSHVEGDFIDFIQMIVDLEQERLEFYLRFL
jgi:Fic family protein